MKRIYNERTEQKVSEHPVGEYFDALVLLKDKCDEKDKYLIYRMNNHAMNGKPAFVFKSSLLMAHLALSMDMDGSDTINEEYAHTDATHDQCRSFKTITLWVYHQVT